MLPYQQAASNKIGSRLLAKGHEDSTPTSEENHSRKNRPENP